MVCIHGGASIEGLRLYEVAKVFQAEQPCKSLAIEDGKFLLEFSPCLADPFNDSFGQLGHEHVSAFIFNVRGFWVCVLVHTGSPPFVAGVDLYEQSLGRILVPEEQRFIKHHRLDPMERNVVIGSRKPVLGKGFRYAR